MLKKKILIVGGTGFIGYWLAKKCLKNNYEVYSISQNDPKKIRFLKNVTYIKCDITNKRKLKKSIPKKINFIVNLGGYVNHNEKKKTFNSHFYGCKNLVDLTLNKKINLFIQMSSSGEYENVNSPHVEDQLISKPVNKYNLAKYMATKYLLKKYKSNNYPFIVLRLYQAFGPRQDMNRLIPIVIESCLKNKTFPCSHGRQNKDFIFIDDLIDLVFKCINSKIKGEIFNAGSGKQINIKYIINLIKKKINKGFPQFGKINLRKDEKLFLYPNISKVKKKLKWKPKISFSRGLIKTINFYKKENKKNLLCDYKK